MSRQSSPWPTGHPCWADLGTVDVEIAKGFYSAVLGWTFDNGRALGDYAIARVDEAATAGIGPVQTGGTSAWTLYFSSNDIASTEAAVNHNGGKTLLPVGEVGELGRMFIGADTSGGVFGVWQSGAHIGAGIVNEPGALTWTDLRSTDPDSAREFYNAIFGYRHDSVDDASAEYSVFTLSRDDEPSGGIGGMLDVEGFPSHWLVYFGVENVAAAVSATENSGGTVLVHDFNTPNGRVAILIDPLGAAFCIIETAAG